MNRKKFKKQLFTILKEACREESVKLDNGLLLKIANVLTPLARTTEGEKINFRSLEGKDVGDKLEDYTESFLSLAKKTRDIPEREGWQYLFSKLGEIVVNEEERQLLVVFNNNKDKKIKGFVAPIEGILRWCEDCREFHDDYDCVRETIVSLTVLKEVN